MKRILYSLLLILTVASVSVFAQKTAKKIDAIRAGESLKYEGKFSKMILRGIDVFDLNFTIENISDSQEYLVKTEAKSKGTLAKIFGLKFYQNFESTVDGKNFSVLKTVKHDEQGDRVRESQAIFDYKNNKVTYIETDPNDVARQPRVVASPVGANTQDLVTGMYLLRRLPLAVGKSFELTVSDSGLTYKIPVRVTAREQQKSVLGKIWCFRVEPEVFGENRLIEKDGNMIIWITDDARRLPVRSQINADIGRIEVKLKQVNYNPPAAISGK